MLANIIVDVLVMYECITGVSAALLGFTVLSWGNSVGDAIASVAISKKGFGEMAFTGCIAGPVFNLLLGLGLTTVRCNMILSEGIKFNVSKEMDEQTKLTVFTLLASIFTLLVLIWLATTNNFKMSKWHGHVLLWIYAIIVGVILCFSLI
jgi:sodium/potassium/calcium exchanger 6